MKQNEIDIYEMLKRVKRFLADNPSANPLITQLATLIITVIAAYEAAATNQTGGNLESAGGVGIRRFKAKELRDYLKDVVRVGRSLDRDVHPGLAEQFVLPRTLSYPKLAAAARAIIAVATPVEAEMVSRELPATFLEDLNALLTAFEAGGDAKVGGKQTQVGGTAGMKVPSRQGLKAAQKLDAIMRARFRNDPVQLAVWKHARHIQAGSQESSPEMPSSPAPAPVPGV